MNPVFSLIARLKGNTEENKTGTSEVIFRNSGLVVPRGIEPISETLEFIEKEPFEIS